MKGSNVFLPLNKAAVGVGLLSSIFLLPLSVSAQSDSDVPVTNSSSNQRGLTEFEINNAKPYRNPLPPPDTNSVQPARGYSPVELPGAIPGVKGKQDDSVAPRAFGSFGVPFTSKRVKHAPTSAVGSSSGNYLSATYPYRAIGRLTFRVGNSTALCSASLIRKSVIVTAAHCIQNFGSGSSVFSNWTFTPASYSPSAITKSHPKNHFIFN